MNVAYRRPWKSMAMLPPAANDDDDDDEDENQTSTTACDTDI